MDDPLRLTASELGVGAMSTSWDKDLELSFSIRVRSQRVFHG